MGLGLFQVDHYFGIPLSFSRMYNPFVGRMMLYCMHCIDEWVLPTRMRLDVFLSAPAAGVRNYIRISIWWWWVWFFGNESFSSNGCCEKFENVTRVTKRWLRKRKANKKNPKLSSFVKQNKNLVIFNPIP